jgi:hypothetical protein
LAGALTTVNFIPETPLPFTDDDALPPPVPVPMPFPYAAPAPPYVYVPSPYAYALPWRGWGHEHGWHQPAQVKRGAPAKRSAVNCNKPLLLFHFLGSNKSQPTEYPRLGQPLLLMMEPICIPSRTEPPALLARTIMRLRLRTAISYFRTQLDSSPTFN